VCGAGSVRWIIIDNLFRQFSIDARTNYFYWVLWLRIFPNLWFGELVVIFSYHLGLEIPVGMVGLGEV
jgi:hypothetical protein